MNAPPIKPLEYDTTPNGVTRRQMSLLLLLVAIDSLVLIVFVSMPTLGPMVRQAWEGYQKRAEERRVEANRQAKFQACLAYQAPVGQVVYAEAPAEAEKLMAGSKLATTLGLPSMERGGMPSELHECLSAGPWRSPALLSRPRELAEWYAVRSGGAGQGYEHPPVTIFLHEMQTPAGARRLVLIEMAPKPVLRDFQTMYELEIRRPFYARVFDASSGRAVTTTAMTIEQSAAAAAAAERPRFVAERGGKYRFQGPASSMWRVFAAQPDPKDPSHVVIAYDIDGVPGKIDGRLGNDERPILTPDRGRHVKWQSGTSYTWDLGPSPTSKPTTAP